MSQALFLSPASRDVSVGAEPGWSAWQKGVGSALRWGNELPAPAFQLTETGLPGGHNLVDLKSGYSASLRPDKEEWDPRGEQETRFSCPTCKIPSPPRLQLANSLLQALRSDAAVTRSGH